MDIFNKRLREELTSLRQSIDAIRDQQERHYQEEKAQRELPPPLGEMEPEAHQIPTEHTQENPNERDGLRIQWITAIATTLAFFAAAYYAGIAKGQLEQLRDQRRAWLGAAPTIEITGEPSFTAEDTPNGKVVKMHIPLKMSLKNSGSTSALSVHVAFSPAWAEQLVTLDKPISFCKQNFEAWHGDYFKDKGEAIFPEQEKSASGTYQFTLGANPPRVSGIGLIACFLYRDIAGIERHTEIAYAPVPKEHTELKKAISPVMFYAPIDNFIMVQARAE